VADVIVPWETLIFSVLLYIVVPLVAGYAVRTILIRTKGAVWFDNVFLARFGSVTVVALLLTLVLLFSFQADQILASPFHIALIAVPLMIQTVFVFALAYGWAYLWRVPHPVAAPAGLIGAQLLRDGRCGGHRALRRDQRGCARDGGGRARTRGAADAGARAVRERIRQPSEAQHQPDVVQP
jgi:hypothetical protein